MFGRRREEKRKNVFDLPFDESVKRLSNIVDDVYRICNNKNFVGVVSKSIKVPKNATQKDLEKIWYGEELAGKVKNFLNVFLIEEKEAILNILSTIFCEEKAEYRKKSINDMIADLQTISNEDKGRLIAFFTPAR